MTLKSSSKKLKFGLGTVQFGMAYGIANRQGKTAPEDVKKILDRAWDFGIRLLDTAPAYGDSQNVIGALKAKDASFEIVSKTPKEGPHTWADSVQQTRDQLKVESLYGVLVHDLKPFIEDRSGAHVKSLLDLKQKGWVRNVGVSVYTADEVDAVLKIFKPDVVQVPVSLLDQRLIRSGWLKRLKSEGIEVHARSIFLQGLLLMSPPAVPPSFDGLAAHLQSLDAALQEKQLSRLAAAMGFVNAIDDVDHIFVGVTQLSELDQILSSIEHIQSLPASSWDFLSTFSWENEKHLNPIFWRKDA